MVHRGSQEQYTLLILDPGHVSYSYHSFYWSELFPLYCHLAVI
jgi:hypothetical protein